MEEIFKFCDDGKVRYCGSDESTIITIWIEDGELCIADESDYDVNANTIYIPTSIISKLILESDKKIIKQQLADYLAQ